uniref:Uncharacterized protein n=1 Tax=Oryza rufipogon TaxID=4529 RepID=A0A0E0QV14_ORYRU
MAVRPPSALPLEGLSSWPEDNREPLTAPGYIKMPGRPRTERRREAHEAPKQTRVSRFGTKIRCRTCKQAPNDQLAVVRVNARAKVSTQAGGSARVDPQANVAGSSSSTSAAVTVTFGKASISLSAQEPAKQTTRKKTGVPLLLIPPWESAKL